MKDLKIIKLKNNEQIPPNYTGIVEWDDGTKAWFLNGKEHRVDGPAVEYADGSKLWYLNGERHREDGPAWEWSNGTKEWWLDGKRHRVDGPAYEGSNGSKEWWLDGKRHRIDGPAVEYANGSKQWFLNGEQFFVSSTETLLDMEQLFETLEASFPNALFDTEKKKLENRRLVLVSRIFPFKDTGSNSFFTLKVDSTANVSVDGEPVIAPVLSEETINELAQVIMKLGIEKIEEKREEESRDTSKPLSLSEIIYNYS